MPVPTRVTPSTTVLAGPIVDSSLLTPSLSVPSTVERLTRIVSDYFLTTSPSDEFEYGGRQVLTAQIKWHVKRNAPLQFVLPAFPFKCPSVKKILGVLPDLAEEIVLRRLEDLCRALEEVYSPGAYLKIVSDGIIYSQLLGVTDSAVFRYNAELRRMASLFRLRHISFIPVRDLFSSSHGFSDLQDLSEDEHLVNAPIARAQFLYTDIGNYDTEPHVKFDEDALRKYRGYLRSLKLDLEGKEAQMWQKISGHEAQQANLSRKTREKLVNATAVRLMENGAKFSALVERAFPHAVRLSVHAHSNAGPKFTLRLFPGVDVPCTPWHNTAVIRLDGSIAIQHSETVDKSTHELVYRYGRPYFWREVDPAMQCSSGDGMEEIRFKHSLLARPTTASVATAISCGHVHVGKMPTPASRYAAISARGLGPAEQDEYSRVGNEMGTLQKPLREDVMEVKEDPTLNSNTAPRESASVPFVPLPSHRVRIMRSLECMPIRSVSKIRGEDGGIRGIPTYPLQLQVIHSRLALSASGADANAIGHTLFANISLIYEQIMMENDVSPYVSEAKPGMFTRLTPTNAPSFNEDTLEPPLVVNYPLSGRSFIRLASTTTWLVLRFMLHNGGAAFNPCA